MDLILPDFAYLRQIQHKLRAVLLTHGHEDHIGALPFALRDFPLPLYGTALTLGLVQVKLDEARLVDGQEFHVVKAGDVVEVGAVSLRVLSHVPQHSRRHGHRRAHADRHDRAHGRLQAGLHPGGRPPAGRSDPGPAGARRRAAVDGRQHLRGSTRLHAVRAGGGGDLRPDLRGGAGPHHRGDVLVARLARAAGVRRGPRLRTQGGAHRAVHGAGCIEWPPTLAMCACPRG